ncbi:MAG TPA: hypothetical protein VK869_04100 [Rubrobacteraceae bacterium]|nr:hypothetical protein [Rubrobacteraceae bacterium]
MAEALSAGRETVRLSPTHRRALGHLELYTTAGVRLDPTSTNGRILARGAANAIRRRRKLLATWP